MSHVSFFRERDKTLVAGDAIATLDMNSWSGLLSGPEIQATPEAFACDFDAVKHSMQVLAALRPRVAACGHGVPVAGNDVADQLQLLADEFVPPAGRYEFEAAQTNDNGVLSMPPKPFDVMKTAALVGGAALLALKLNARRKNNRA